VAFRDRAPSVSLAAVAVPGSLPTASAAPMAKAVLASFREKQMRRTGNAAAKRVEARLTPALGGADSAAKVMAAAGKQAVAGAQTVLVVMRTEQFGPGGASWTVQVWRFTMLKAEQVPAGLKNPAKSL
jgi:hypothetical protein